MMYEYVVYDVKEKRNDYKTNQKQTKTNYKYSLNISYPSLFSLTKSSILSF